MSNVYVSVNENDNDHSLA